MPKRFRQKNVYHQEHLIYGVNEDAIMEDENEVNVINCEDTRYFLLTSIHICSMTERKRLTRFYFQMEKIEMSI